MVPSLRRSCSKARWCWLPGCEERTSRLSGPSVPRRTQETKKCSFPSHRRRPAVQARLAQRPSLSKLLLATRLVPAPPQSVFLREAKPLHQPPYGGAAHIRPRYVLQKAASFADGGARALLYILFEKGSGFLVRLAGSSRALSWREGVSLSDPPSVSLERGEAHVEGAGRLSFGHASLYGSDYLLAEVFGVGSHPSMIACGSKFMLNAVEEGNSCCLTRSMHDLALQP